MQRDTILEVAILNADLLDDACLCTIKPCFLLAALAVSVPSFGVNHEPECEQESNEQTRDAFQFFRRIVILHDGSFFDLTDEERKDLPSKGSNDNSSTEGRVKVRELR